MEIDYGFRRAGDGFADLLPNLVGFVVLLVVGYVLALLARRLLRGVLGSSGVDDAVQASPTAGYVARATRGAKPSSVLAAAAFWLVLLLFVLLAVGVLGLTVVDRFVLAVAAYLPNVLVAALIVVVALLLAGAAPRAAAAALGHTPAARIAAAVAPALVMVIAVFMVLQQLRVAEEIVQIAFAATMGAVALGLALAFGLGGRGVAQQMLEDAYRKGQEQKEQVKQDPRTGRERTETAMAGAEKQVPDDDPADAPRDSSAGKAPDTPVDAPPEAPTATYPTPPAGGSMPPG